MFWPAYELRYVYVVIFPIDQKSIVYFTISVSFINDLQQNIGESSTKFRKKVIFVFRVSMYLGKSWGPQAINSFMTEVSIV